MSEGAKKQKSKYSTPEEAREAKRVRNRAAGKRRKAERAIAEGRIPGVTGGVRKLSDEERKLARKASYKKWRETNIEYVRKRDAAFKQQLRLQKAADEGRELRKVGRIRRLTDEQRLENARANSRSYRKKYPDRSEKIQRNYYEKNKERIVARTGRNLKKFKQEFPEEYRKRVATSDRNRRSRKVEAGGTHTTADIKHLWNLQKGKCVFCLKKLYDGKYHVDHHIPLAKGGSNDRGNLRLLHKKCNLEKHARDPVDHARRNGMLCW